jgi:hypothetical protein
LCYFIIRNCGWLSGGWRMIAGNLLMRSSIEVNFNFWWNFLWDCLGSLVCRVFKLEFFWENFEGSFLSRFLYFYVSLSFRCALSNTLSNYLKETFCFVFSLNADSLSLLSFDFFLFFIWFDSICIISAVLSSGVANLHLRPQKKFFDSSSDGKSAILAFFDVFSQFSVKIWPENSIFWPFFQSQNSFEE